MTVLDEATRDDLPKVELSRSRRLLLTVVGKSARVYVKVRDAKLTLSVPAVAGAGLVSAGVALRFGVWAGLIVAGVFCLRLDARIR